MKTIPIRPLLAPKFLLFVFAALVLLAGCDLTGIRGNGNIVTEQRNVSEFSSVEARGALRVEWKPGAAMLSLTADQNLLSLIETAVSGRKLILHPRDNIRPSQTIVVRISSPGLTSVALRGAVRFQAANINTSDFYLDGEGATRTELSGTATALHAAISGAGRLDADSMHAQQVELSISGAGRAEVNASDKLSATISGAGKVIYSGNPRAIERKISGAGSIQPRG
jgi:hypothetical protein